MSAEHPTDRTQKLRAWLSTPAGGALLLYTLFLSLYLLTSPLRFDGVDGGLRFQVARSILYRGQFHLDRVRVMPIVPYTTIWGDGAMIWILATSKPPLPIHALEAADYKALRGFVRLYGTSFVYRGRRLIRAGRLTPLTIWGEDWRELHPEGTRVGRNSRIFANYPLAHSIVMLPFVWIGGEKAAATSLAVIAPLAPVLVFLILLQLGFSARRCLGVGLIAGAASILWPYATSTHDSALSAVMILLTLYGSLLARDRHWSWSLLAGCGAGLALMVKHSNLVVLLAVGFLVVAVPLWRYFRKQQGRIHDALWRLGGAVVGFAPFLLVDRLYYLHRFSGVTTRGVATSIHPDVPTGTVSQLIARVLGVNTEGLYGFLISPQKSLLLFTPPLILVCLVAHRFWKRDSSFTFGALLFVLASYVGHGLLPHWGGDYAWGPRYLVASSVVLLLPLAAWTWRGAWRWLLIAVVAFGVLVQLGATFVDNDRYYSERRLEQGWHYDAKKRSEIYFSASHVRILEQLSTAWTLAGRTVETLDRVGDLKPGEKPTAKLFHDERPVIRDGTDYMLASRTWWNLLHCWYPLAMYKRWAGPGVLNFLLALNLLLLLEMMLLAGWALKAGDRKKREPV